MLNLSFILLQHIGNHMQLTVAYLVSSRFYSLRVIRILYSSASMLNWDKSYLPFLTSLNHVRLSQARFTANPSNSMTAAAAAAPHYSDPISLHWVLDSLIRSKYYRAMLKGSLVRRTVSLTGHTDKKVPGSPMSPTTSYRWCWICCFA